MQREEEEAMCLQDYEEEEEGEEEEEEEGQLDDKINLGTWNDQLNCGPIKKLLGN